jgi:REP element-mobilizing transposase RayT
MVRLARAEVLDPGEVAIAHVCNRTVRRCFLIGQDPLSGKNFDHRKQWIEDYLRQFAASFGIDLLGFAILSNHFHLILRTRPDVVATWSDQEVARRWLRLCPLHRHADGSPGEPTQPEIDSIAGCPVKRVEIRQRLSSISWWMRLLCQRVAMRANHEDEETGRFFQDRYRATRLADEASLLACAAYVDLNPIRAAMCETLEASDHTSAQRRIEAIPAASPSMPDSEAPVTLRPVMSAESSAGKPAPPAGVDSFLSPLTINERTDPVGPCVSAGGQRCSDKGFLAMRLEDYLQLLDWTARQSVAGKRGVTPAGLPPVLQRLGLDGSKWCELVGDFGRLYSTVAGRPECVDALRSHRTHRRYHLRRRVRELWSSGA